MLVTPCLVLALAAYAWGAGVAGATTPGFTLSASPTSVTVVAGTSGSSTVSVVASGGFAGTVALKVSGLPAGASASFSRTTLAGGGTSTLSIVTAASTVAGNYTAVVTATSGAISHATNVPLHVQSFALSASPTSLTMVAGSAAKTATVWVAGINGFAGSVALTVAGMPAGLSASFAPASVTGTGTSTLSVTTAASTAPGTYTLTVTATSGVLTRSANLTVAVQAFSFSGQASTSAVTGTKASLTVSVAAQNGFVAAVALTVSGLPAGTNASFAPASINGSGSSTLSIWSTLLVVPGTYPLTLTATSGALTRTLTVNLNLQGFSLSGSPASLSAVAGSAASSSIAVSAISGFTGAVTLAASGLPAGASASFAPASVSAGGSSTLSIATTSATVPGSYALTLTGTSGALKSSLTVSLDVTAFSLSASPASITVVAGSAVSSTVAVAPLNGFAGTTGLSVSGLPIGASASFTPVSLSGAGASTLAITTTSVTAAGSYPLTVSGTSGALTVSTTVTLGVQGFSLSASPASLAVVVGNVAVSTVGISVSSGFAGAVGLTVSGLPAGSSVSFAPASVTGSGASTLSIATTGATPPGTYTVVVTGTSGVLARSTSIAVDVQPAFVVPAPLLFDGDFETGSYQLWNTPECANYGQVATSTRAFGNFFIDTSQVGQGHYAGRFDVPADGTKLTRCEVYDSRTIGVGTDTYYGLMVYLPNGWTPGTTGPNGFWGVNIAQLNFENIYGPPVALQAHSDHITLALQTGACTSASSSNPSCDWASNADSPGSPNLPALYAIPAPMQLGVWHELILHAHWATDSTGQIEVWHKLKGQTGWAKTVSFSGYPTVQTYQDGTYPTAVLDKTGAYRDLSDTPTSVWLDGFGTSSSFAAATSNMP